MTATESFIEAATKFSGVSADVARAALKTFVKVGLVKFDPCAGGYTVLTAAVYEAENLTHAAEMAA